MTNPDSKIIVCYMFIGLVYLATTYLPHIPLKFSDFIQTLTIFVLTSDVKKLVWA